MTRKALFVGVILIILSSCKHRSRIVTHISKQQIILQPFSDIDSTLAISLKSKLEDRLNAEVLIQQSVALPRQAYYPLRNRYIADSLLIFLEEHKGSKHDKIIGVTSKDISTRKNGAANWGIMGLGYCPGEACVVSAFRVKKTSRNRKHFEDRMLILSMHELGHTYSLPHCKNDPCIMKDAEGKMNLDKTNNYCPSCQKSLQAQGLLN